MIKGPRGRAYQSNIKALPPAAPDKDPRAKEAQTGCFQEADSLAFRFGLTHLSITAIVNLANLIAHIRNETVR